MSSRGAGAGRMAPVVIGVLGLLAGAAAFVATKGVIEAITAAAIVIAVTSVGIRWARSIG